MATEWLEIAWVHRSHEADAVWVPTVGDGDESLFLHAGPIRRVKAYLVRSYARGERWRWRRESPDIWILEVAEEGPRA